MATYYVDATLGDDSDDGLAPTDEGGGVGPWQTISKVNGETFSADDFILFKRGETWDCNADAVLTPPSSGSSGSPIVFGAYGTGADPILDGDGSAANCVRIAAKTYVTIQDFTILGWTGRGVYATNATGTVVQRCTVSGGNGASPDHGIQIQGTADPAETDVEVKDNIIGTIGTSENDTVGFNGIIVQGVTGAVISGNVVNTTNCVGIRLISGGGSDNLSCTVENNELYGCYGGLLVSNADSTVIRYNVIRDGKGLGIGVAFDADDTEIYYNLIYNLTVKSTNLWNGIDINHDCQDGVVYNNTIYNVSGHSIVIDDETASCDGWVFTNNILDASQNNNDAVTPKCIRIGGASVTWTSDHNLFWIGTSGAQLAETGEGTFRTFSDWKSTTSEDANSVEADPLFVNAGGSNAADYKVIKSSPCVDAGADVSLTTDYFGGTVPAGDSQEIGIYEYQGAGTGAGSNALSIALYGVPGMLGGASWTPAELSNLELWLRPEDLGADSTLVTNWPDQSGNGNDATQSVTSQKPLVQAPVLDGYAGALFDGVDDNLALTSQIDFTGAHEVWSVYKSLEDDTAIVGLSASNYALRNLTDRVYVRPEGSGALALTGTTLAEGTYRLIRVARDGSDDYTCEANGVDETSGTPNQSGTVSVSKINAIGTFANVILNEIVLVSAVLSADDRTSLLAYFSGRFPTLGI